HCVGHAIFDCDSVRMNEQLAILPNYSSVQSRFESALVGLPIQDCAIAGGELGEHVAIVVDDARCVSPAKRYQTIVHWFDRSNVGGAVRIALVLKVGGDLLANGRRDANVIESVPLGLMAESVER